MSSVFALSYRRPCNSKLEIDLVSWDRPGPLCEGCPEMSRVLRSGTRTWPSWSSGVTGPGLQPRPGQPWLGHLEWTGVGVSAHPAGRVEPHFILSVHFPLEVKMHLFTGNLQYLRYHIPTNRGTTVKKMKVLTPCCFSRATSVRPGDMAQVTGQRSWI